MMKASAVQAVSLMVMTKIRLMNMALRSSTLIAFLAILWSQTSTLRVESKNSSLIIDPKELGGFLNLSGIPRNSLIGHNKAFGSLVYRYRWFDNDFGLFSSPFYLGASFEYGGVWSDPSIKLDTAPLYAAGSVFAGVDSPVGPIMFGYGRTEQNFDSIY